MSKINNLHKRLKELREAKGLTQLQLAEALDIGRVSVSNYENGDRTPDADLIIRFADYFGVSADYLLGISEFKCYGQEYDFRRKLAPEFFNRYDDFTKIYENFSSSLDLFELNAMMVSIDENYSSIIAQIITGNEKYRTLALTALNQLLKAITYTGDTIKEDDNDMREYIQFLDRLKDSPLYSSDFGHIQANQTQIRYCTISLNEFISLYVYALIDLEKQKLNTEV